MTAPARLSPEPRISLSSSLEEVTRIAARAGHAPRVALDVEANGLFAYQASLCVLQLAWEEDGRIAVAVVDARATSIEPLRGVLGPEGPVKVLHDLSFDARLLEETGVPLGLPVRDTAVAARMLGAAATGLSAVLASELGVTIDKHLQQHDWSRRPLTAEQIVYLAEDVLYLLSLDDHLARKACALDIAPEIADECAHRLAAVGRPPRDARPAYARIKGAAALDPKGRAALRHLVDARDAVARAEDTPPFKVLSNEALLAVAQKLPTTLPALFSIRGLGVGRLGPHGERLLAAVEAGLRDGDVPPEHAHLFEPPPSPGRAAIAARRAVEGRISAFRKAEARRRGVDEQVVLPGHCAQSLADVFLAHAPEDAALPDAIAGIPGLGARRLALYGEALLGLARGIDVPRNAADDERT